MTGPRRLVGRSVARLARAAVASATAAAHLAVLTAPAFADPMKTRAAEGQSFAGGLIVAPESLVRMGPDGSTVRLFPDTSAPLDLRLDALFPAAGGPVAVDPRALYGDDDGARAAGAAAAGTLGAAPTPVGEAWRTAIDSRARSGADLSGDPVLDQTRALIGSLDRLAGEFTACAPVTGFAPRDLVNRATVERRCLRASAPSRIETVRHSFDIAVEPMRLDLAAPGPALDVRVDFLAGEAVVGYETLAEEWRCSGGDGEFSGGESCERVAVSGRREARMAAPRLDGDAFCGPAARQVLGVMQESARIGDAPRALGPGPAPDCANALVYAASVAGPGCFVSIRTVGRDDDEVREIVCPSSSITLQFAVTTVTEDAWGLADVVDGLVALEASGCAPAYTTVAGGQRGDRRCLDVGGGRICPGDPVYALLKPAPFDPGETRVSRLATRVSADLSTCRPLAPPAESCAPLLADPGCAFRTTWPVTGDGVTEVTMHEDVYDCEIARTVRSVAATGGLACPPAVRGLGDDLVTPAYETNASFHEVAARLAAAQFTAMDTLCGDAGDRSADPLACRVFDGERRTCKVAAFGIVDCCSSPGGVSLVQYLQLAFAIGELDGAIGHLDKTSPIVGAWERVAAPFDAAYDIVVRNFASGVNSITGIEVFNPSELVQKGLIGTIEQALMDQTAQWTASVFGDAAANALFVSAVDPTAPAVIAGVIDPAGVALGPTLSTVASALSVVMLAYTIYNVALLIATIVWSCSGSELETAVKRELRACHSNGQYCARSVFGFCLERRRSYCCFASPLSRIMQEQIRLQQGRGWGSARNPDCGGLSVAELQTVDFGALDLGEWMDILLDTGVMPDGAAATVEAMTGSGRALAGALPAGMERLDIVDRSIGRMRGVDAQRLRQDAQRSIIGDLGP